MNDMILASDFPTDAEMFKYMENEEARRRAYVLYVGENMKPSDIATEIAIPVSTIRQWVMKGMWHKRQLEARNQRQQEEQFALDLFRDDNRLEEVKQQLAAGKKGQELVMEMLDGGDLTPDQLKKVADALKSFSDVAARAVGLGETVETKDAKGEDKAGRIRPPAVVIVAGQGAKVQVREQP